METENISKKEAEERAFGNSDIYEWAWDDFKENLNEAMKTMGDPGYWKAEGRNMGWQHRSGYAFLRAYVASELLRKILPKTEVNIEIYWGPFHRSMEWEVSHHDAPTGEFYTVRPATKKELEEEDFI